MITNIYGKIGGGKTYYSVKEEIIEELVCGYRVVVTNVALDLSNLAFLLAERYPEGDPIDLHDRVRILTIDEMGEFFAHREHGNDLEVPTLDEWRKGKNVNYDTCKRAVKYVLDEVHVKFDARGWQSQGPHVTFYNSQHRKLDDEIVFISQFPELVDKRLKGFAQEHVYCENHALERLFTVFRAPAYFTASSYLRERTGQNDVAQWKTRFTLDLKIAGCYDTSAGVGIRGRKKPESRKKKGISVIWGVAAVCVAGGLLLWLSDWVPKKLTGADKKPMTKQEVAKAGGEQKEGQKQAGGPPEFMQPPKSLPAIMEDRTPPQALYCTGMSSTENRFTMQLSDGRTLNESMGIVKAWDSGRIILVTGETIWLLPRARPLEVPVVPDKEEPTEEPVSETASGPSKKKTEERQPPIWPG